MAYAEAKRGNADALKEEAIRESFPIVLAGEIKSLAEVYGGGEYLDGIVADAQEFLITYSPLLQWKL